MMSPKIARVFPRKTNASPEDEYSFFDAPGMFLPEIDEVHISVAFTYDLPRAEILAKAWEHIAPVGIGGPAMGEAGGEFIPGMYLKPGYVITSRGCPNRCWFFFESRGSLCLFGLLQFVFGLWFLVLLLS